MDNMKTKEYYEAIASDDVCQCDYCQSYVKYIRATYPVVSEYLETIGVDIEKPFETMPLALEDTGNIFYIGVQYVVIGSRANFEAVFVGDVEVKITRSHPSTNIEGEHFVFQIFSF